MVINSNTSNIIDSGKKHKNKKKQLIVPVLKFKYYEIILLAFTNEIFFLQITKMNFFLSCLKDRKLYDRSFRI